MAKTPTDKHTNTLRDKSTGNLAMDAYAYGPWPHLFNVLTNKYAVPPSFFITLNFLWDRTVGSKDTPCGDIALSQIPGRRQEKVKWLAALVSARFFERVKTQPGGKDQEGSFYAYDVKVTADEWDEFFKRAAMLASFPKWDEVKGEVFSRLFADVRDPAGPARVHFDNLFAWLSKGKQKTSGKA